MDNIRCGRRIVVLPRKVSIRYPQATTRVRYEEALPRSRRSRHHGLWDPPSNKRSPADHTAEGRRENEWNEPSPSFSLFRNHPYLSTFRHVQNSRRSSTIVTMPSLILTGYPSSGKSTVAEMLKERALLLPSIQAVEIINEATACPDWTKQECYATSLAEKQTRAALKSAFDRAVATSNKKTLVVLDSLNYIKGM